MIRNPKSHGPRRWTQTLLLTLTLVLGLCAAAMGQSIDQAKPSRMPADPHAGMSTPQVSDSASRAALFARQNRATFEANIHLDDFRLLAIQHQDQVKIIDSWARQSLYAIRHKYSIDGKDCLLLALDMAMRPEAWIDKNIIYVESVPIRDQLGAMTGSAPEATRIHNEGTISPTFYKRDDIQQTLAQLAASDSRQSDAIGKVEMAFRTFESLYDSLALLPPPADRRGTPWVHPFALIVSDRLKADNQPIPPQLKDLPVYTQDQKLKIELAMEKLEDGWQRNDVDLANQGLAAFVALAPTIDPPAYPSSAKRTTELWYNRTYSGTIVAFVYFVAMVLLLLVTLGAVQKTGRTRLVGLWFFGAALAFHLTAIGVRWWINGRIPIQNQFESVMGAACLGCMLGFLLEARWIGKAVGWFLLPAVFGAVTATLSYWYMPIGLLIAVAGGAIVAGLLYALQIRFKIAAAIDGAIKKISPGVFGTAFSFVGFLATTLMLAAPYVFPSDLGAAGGRVAGVLMTGWLYIHVNIVIASYALIAASAAIALIFLGLSQWFWVNPIEPALANAIDDGVGGGGSDLAPRGGSTKIAATPEVAGLVQQAAQINQERSRILDGLDQANMIILQMAFWMLGVGILCGAVWADQSWGRPWGWDPKETFALVTWIVYLLIVHVRLVIKHKGLTTAFLAILGFVVMLFNYIGVNYFLAGLHSYA